MTKHTLTATVRGTEYTIRLSANAYDAQAACGCDLVEEIAFFLDHGYESLLRAILDGASDEPEQGIVRGLTEYAQEIEFACERV